MFASVLIVNFNSGGQLAACLASLELQSLPRAQFEVIIVDNGSVDDSFETAKRHHPSMMFIRSNSNLGFAEGNNLAARHAIGDPLVLLNPDTIADPFWLEELLATMARRNAAAAVSKLVFASDPRMINSGGLHLLRDGRGADAGFEQFDDGRFEAERPVFAGCGAALAIRRDCFELNGSLFLYYEDLDAAWRLQSRGEAVWYAPRALVQHAVGAAPSSPIHRFYVERNRALTAVRHADFALAIYALLVLMFKVPQAVLNWLTGRLSLRTALAVPRAFAAALWSLPQALAERYVNRSWRLR